MKLFLRADKVMKSINWGVYLREPSWDVGKIQDFIKHAEDLGFCGIYTNDHLTGFDKSLGGKESYLEAWTFITAILSWSKRLRAGHTVLCQSFRNPALLAKMVSSLDILSGGRFDLFWGLVGRKMNIKHIVTRFLHLELVYAS